MASRQLAARRFFSTFYRWTRLTCAATPHRPRSKLCQIRPPPTAITHRWFSGSAFNLQAEEATGSADKDGLETTEMARVGTTQHSEGIPSKGETYALRQVMRRVPYPAVIITSASMTPGSDKSTPQAMTVSSFNTVSLDPDPMISFNIRKPSRTLDAIQSSGRFLIHIPMGTERSSFLVDAFSRNHAQEAFEKLSQLGATISPHVETGTPTPHIDHPDMMATLTCDLVGDKMTDVNDHVVVIGRVVRVKDHKSNTLNVHSGLLYMNRNYRTVGEAVGSHGLEAKTGIIEKTSGFSMVESPCFPGPEDAQSLRDAIREFALKNSDFVFSSVPRTVREFLEKEFRLRPSALGVNILQVLFNIGVSKRMNMGELYKDYGSPEILKYCGTIYKDQIPQIVQEAKPTIEQRSDVWNLHYTGFLFACNINPWDRDGFYFEDLLNGFRDAGLLGERKYTNLAPSELNGRLTIEKAEEAELRFRAAMRRRPVARWVLNRSTEDFQEVLDNSEMDWARAYLQPIFPSLIVEHNYKRYRYKMFDYYGDITHEQSQVIMQRVLNLISEDPILHLNTHEYEILENVRVHPHTKFDMGFLKHKLRGAMEDDGLKNVRRVIAKIRREYGISIPLRAAAATTSRIRSFIEEDRYRAVQLGIEGILKELGIFPDATMPYRGSEVPLKANPLLTVLLGETMPLEKRGLLRKMKTDSASATTAAKVAYGVFRRKQDELSSSSSTPSVESAVGLMGEPKQGDFSIKELGEFHFNQENDAHDREYQRFMDGETPANEVEAQPRQAPSSDSPADDAERAALMAKFGAQVNPPDTKEQS